MSNLNLSSVDSEGNPKVSEEDIAKCTSEVYRNDFEDSSNDLTGKKKTIGTLSTATPKSSHLNTPKRQ